MKATVHMKREVPSVGLMQELKMAIMTMDPIVARGGKAMGPSVSPYGCRHR